MGRGFNGSEDEILPLAEAGAGRANRVPGVDDRFPHICFLFAYRSTLFLRGRTMQILTWDDRKNPSQPRALIQQGRCDDGECNQFSISISNGERGMTVRFESEAEFRNFLERGAAEKR